MPNGINRIADLLSAPMEAVIIALGVSIAKAQRELDRNSMEAQREINEDPLLGDLGLQATWYQMPHTELELTMAIAMEAQPKPPTVTPLPGVPTALKAFPLKQLHIQPVNAAYTNQFNYDVNAASKLKLTIVPVPPPGAEAAVAPKLTRDDVTNIVRPQLVVDPNARLAVNFSGHTRLWTVVQYRVEGDETKRLKLVVVDDDTRQIVNEA